MKREQKNLAGKLHEIDDEKKLKTAVEDYEEYREPSGWVKIVILLLGVALTVFSLYTAQFGLLVANKQRAIFLAFSIAIAFLLHPGFTGKRGKVGLIDVLLAIGGFFSAFYIVIVFDQLAMRQGWPTKTDFVMGVLTIIFLVIAAYRLVGWILPTICCFFLAYCYIGKWLPGQFGHRGFSVVSIVRHMYLSTEGIFGLPLGVVADFIYLFIFFGVILLRTGVGKVFIDLAMASLGGQRGGPAKVAVIASSFFGTINGSSVANVVGTGTFTIPLMKSVGFKPNFAAAVEACASVGGQIMPPIMGAAAFIMAEFLGISYLQVALAATLPAILYFGSVLSAVHFESHRLGLEGLPREMLPSLKKVLIKDGILLLPIPVVVGFLVKGFTPTMAALWGIYISLVIPWFRKEGRYSFSELVDMFVQGAKSAHNLVVLCGVIGFIIGASSLTGFGLKLAGAIVALSHGFLFPALVLTMIASIILGMGIPTTGNYIMMALITAPALRLMGVAPIAAHMFVFYFGIISDLTPPVALLALVAANIAKGDFWKTAMNGIKIAIAGFIVPYMFVYNPGLLITPDNFHPLMTLLNIVSAVIGVIFLAAAVQNYFFSSMKAYERIILVFAALLLIAPKISLGLLGLFIGLGIMLLTRNRASSQQKDVVLAEE